MSATGIVLPHANQINVFNNLVQAAIVRSTASLFMWLFAVFAFLVDEIQVSNLIGISCSVLFLAFAIPLLLPLVKRPACKNAYAGMPLVVYMLEVIGYTGVIFSLGGVEATYLTPIYAAFISYQGVLEPKKVPYILASFCALAFGTMAALDMLGIIPSLKVDSNFTPSVAAQFIRVFVVIGLLFIVAYVSSFTAGILEQKRNQLSRQNNKLKEKTILLEKSQFSLKQKNEELQNALNEIETLRGIIPICANCKKIRDDNGYWNQLEKYIMEHSEAYFSHSLCPDCIIQLYPEIENDEKAPTHKK